MKIWLILGGLAAGVLLLIGALRATSLTSGQTPDRISEVHTSSENYAAASSRLSTPNELSPGIVPPDESSVADKAALLERLPEGDEQRDRARELLTKLFEFDRPPPLRLLPHYTNHSRCKWLPRSRPCGPRRILKVQSNGRRTCL
jgi:hypothetical protein